MNKNNNNRNTKRTSLQLQESIIYTENILATIREPLLVLNGNLRIISANQSFYKTFLVTPQNTEGKLIYEIGDGEWNIPKLKKLLENILPQNTKFDDYEVDHNFPSIGHRTMLLNARRIHNGDKGKTQTILLAIEDITDRKETKHRLASSELRYRRLFETAQDGIMILDARTGEIKDVNPFLVRMMGYTKKAYLGKKLWEIGFFKDEKANRRAFRILQDKGYIRYEDLPLEATNGKRMDVEFVSNVYQIDGEKVIQCNVRDISDRKKTDESLIQSEKLYHSLFDNMMDGYAYCKMLFNKDLPQDFVYLKVNKAFETLTGLKDVEGKRLSEVIPGLKDTNPELFEIYARVALTGKTEKFETYLTQLDRWFSISVYRPQKGFFVAVFDNITDRKQAEKTLMESEQRFRDSEQRLHLAQDSANAGTWEWDLRTGKNYWSDEIWRLYGLAPYSCEPSYDAWAKTIHPDDRPIVEAAVQEAATNGTRLNAEWRVNTTSGVERWLMSVGQPVPDHTGKIARFIGIVIDISDRKKVETLKDEFIGMVSHELKTPVTVIMGAIYTAMSEGISKKEIRELLTDAVTSADSLSRIVDNLLDLSRNQAKRLQINQEPTDIDVLVHNVVNKQKDRSGIHQIIVDIPSGLGLIETDRVRIERILHNLIDNAIKYSPEGGDIIVFARRENKHLLIGVKDSGIGISVEDQARLFTPFERLQTTDGVRGIGLGLVVCRVLVEAHGGRIWVESQPGQGSTFFFTLPLH